MFRNSVITIWIITAAHFALLFASVRAIALLGGLQEIKIPQIKSNP